MVYFFAMALFQLFAGLFFFLVIGTELSRQRKVIEKFRSRSQRLPLGHRYHTAYAKNQKHAKICLLTIVTSPLSGVLVPVLVGGYAGWKMYKFAALVFDPLPKEEER